MASQSIVDGTIHHLSGNTLNRSVPPLRSVSLDLLLWHLMIRTILLYAGANKRHPARFT
jgi:hypothetical protein